MIENIEGEELFDLFVFPNTDFFFFFVAVTFFCSFFGFLFVLTDSG